MRRRAGRDQHVRVALVSIDHRIPSAGYRSYPIARYAIQDKSVCDIHRYRRYRQMLADESSFIGPR
jgi:hypothetical protein